MKNKKIALNNMGTGQTGVIMDIRGGRGMILKLSTLGIMAGEEITKVSQQVMHGPVVVKIGRSQVAIGFGMAKNILVRISEEADG